MMTRGRTRLAVAAALLVLLPTGAGAQLEIRSLPGDPPGEKRPFQHRIQKYVDPPPFWFEEIPLPSCAVHLTIETVTAVVSSTEPEHHPRIDLYLAQNGRVSGHIVALTPVQSRPESAAYQATHAVRLHHDVSPEHAPVVNLYSSAAAQFEVSIAGYTTQQCRRSSPTLER